MSKPVKVLVVEDNSLNLKLFQDLLTLKKYQVLVSHSGHGVVELASTELPNLILMDIQLSGISGIDIIKELKSNKDTAGIPIIAITAFAMKHDEATIKLTGCDFYMSKPVSIDDFFAAVDKFTLPNHKKQPSKVSS